MTLASVLLVEDDLFMRATLSALLTTKGFNVVGAVDTAEEALYLQNTFNPDVVIADLDLGPGPNGIDITSALREFNPKIGIIFLTTFSDPRLADLNNLPIPKGAVYFTKSKLGDPAILITAILQVSRNPLFHQRVKNSELAHLTETQIEILKLVSQGHTTASIATQRNVSEKSVEAMLSRIHSALELPKAKNLNPRVQLTRAFFALAGKKPPGE